MQPLGLSSIDAIELLLAVLLAAIPFLWQPRLAALVTRVAGNTRFCIIGLAALPLLLRFALLAAHPVPLPANYDEFSHLLVADTLLHARLANPAHPMARFFETFFVLQDPSYSSIYPIGLGFSMAFGKLLFGLPWAGVLLTTAAFCGACYWMLRGWTTPLWSLGGGLLAVSIYGPLPVDEHVLGRIVDSHGWLPGLRGRGKTAGNAVGPQWCLTGRRAGHASA